LNKRSASSSASSVSPFGAKRRRRIRLVRRARSRLYLDQIRPHEIRPHGLVFDWSAICPWGTDGVKYRRRY
jgi:hypothetical protein